MDYVGRYVFSPSRAAALPALPASVCDRKRSFSGFTVIAAVVWGWLNLLPVPDSCRVLRTGRAGQGARSARAAAPQASLIRPPGSGSCLAAGREPLGGGCGSAVQAGGLSMQVRSAVAAGGGARSSQPYLGPRGEGGTPAT